MVKTYKKSNSPLVVKNYFSCILEMYNYAKSDNFAECCLT